MRFGARRERTTKKELVLTDELCHCDIYTKFFFGRCIFKIRNELG